MAAVVRASIYAASASEPAGATAEGGIKFNREDTATGTTPIPIPTIAAGTNYSWHKNLALEVTTLAATTISNRRAYLSGAPATGLYLFFKEGTAYVQAALTASDEVTTNGAVPSTYTALTATTLGGAQVWQAAGVSAGSTGRNGSFLRLALGIGANFAGGAGSATVLPNLLMVYDEA